MPCKNVIDREEASLAAEQAAIAFGAQAAERLAGRLDAELADVAPPRDLAQLVRFLGRTLERCRLRMVEADLAHDGARLAWQVRSRRRRAAADELRRRLVETRTGLARLCAAGSPPHRAAAGPTARDNQRALLRQAAELLAALRRPDAPAEAAARAVPGVTLDLGVLAAALDAARAALAEAREAERTARHGVRGTLSARRRAVAAHDTAYRQATRLLEVLFEVAGMAAWAGLARRPAARRATRRAAPAGRAGAGTPGVNGSAR